ncbi:hypothetical protein HDU76_001373 [Blyttiomyces sp. JEL0837]|nr:hypothetical protein HDU76_001373 [Blyttiomyces sp. JEL0837]
MPENNSTSSSTYEDFQSFCPQCLLYAEGRQTGCRHPWHTWESKYRQSLQHEFSGEFRQAANLYMAAFKESDPKLWRMRFRVLGCYIGLLVNHSTLRDENDLEYLKQVEKNVDEPWHFRLCAGTGSAYIFNSRSEHKKAAKRLIRAVRLGLEALLEGNASSEYLNSSIMTAIDRGAGPKTEQVKAVIGGLLNSASNRLFDMQGKTADMIVKNDEWNKLDSSFLTMSTSPSDRNIATKILGSPFLPSLTCAGCGMQRFLKIDGTITENKNVTLKRCSKCQRLAYCSKECQRSHWFDGGHKAVCREIGTFREGDYVEVCGLVNRGDLNGAIAEVDRVVEKDDGTFRYAVERRGNRAGKVLVKAENIRMLLSTEER